MTSIVPAVEPFSLVNLTFNGLEDNGDVIFPWPGKTNLSVRLYNNPMFVGKDKLVFKVRETRST
jgi:hypothetical protein